LLARPDARTLAILGAGVQARSHLRALANVRGFEQVRVYAPTAAHARAVVEEADMAGGELSVAASAEEAVRGADVVVAGAQRPGAGARARLARARSPRQRGRRQHPADA